MKSICLINVWIGTLPESFPLFLKTVQYNTTVDFYFVTDQDFCCELQNVHFIKMSLAEIKERFEVEVGMKIKLKYIYKLCDFKPIWRVLLPQNVISMYDYWGHCDLDIMLGDIRSFLTDELLENYDRIFDAGHLSIYRNNDEMNNLYKRSADRDNMAYPYNRAFKTNYACYFDEYMGMSILVWQYKRSYADQTKEDMVQDFGWQRYDFASYIDGKSFVFQWKEGKLYKYIVDEQGIIDPKEIEPKEYVELHIQKRRMNMNIDVNKLDELSEFWIYPNAYDAKMPTGPLYNEQKLKEYAEEIRRQDKRKRINNLKRYGLIDYIPHFLISKRIIRYIVKEKKFF